MILNPKARALALIVLIPVLGVLALSRLGGNLASLAIVRELAHPAASTGIAPPPVPDQQRRLLGALWLARGDHTQGKQLLQEYLNNASPDDTLAWLLLARAYSSAGDFLQAGHAYDRAGLFRTVREQKNLESLKATVAITQVVALGRAALALAREAEDGGDFATALLYVQLAFRLSGDDVARAEMHRMESAAALEAGNYRTAILAARRSLDILSPADASDSRFGLLFESVAQLVQGSRCRVEQNDGLFALLAIYSPDPALLPNECLEHLIESVLVYLPEEQHSFILLRKAMIELKLGHIVDAQALLRRAESQGLPPAWSYVLLPQDFVADVQTPFEPTYPVADDRLLGYEVDPVQVELGLSLDMILIYRDRQAPILDEVVSVGGVDLLFYEAVNLAPNPGFEYPASEECQSEGCLPFGYETDIYDAPPEVHRIVPVNRPLSPGQPESGFTSLALQLDNGRNRLRKSGASSFSRPLSPDATYLHAAWVRSTGGHGYVGRVWEGTQQTPPYDYVVAGYAQDNWTHVRQIVRPPMDAHTLRLWLLNYDSIGAVLFDGVVFIRLPH